MVLRHDAKDGQFADGWWTPRIPGTGYQPQVLDTFTDSDLGGARSGTHIGIGGRCVGWGHAGNAVHRGSIHDGGLRAAGEARASPPHGLTLS